MSENTKQTIADAYLQLLAQGGSQTITVKDVVDLAGVSRMTFYYHFTDIYDLVDWIYRQYFSSLAAKVTHVSEVWTLLSGTIVDMIDNNTLGILDNYQHLDRAILDKQLTRLLHDLVGACFDVDPDMAKYSKPDRDFLVQLITYCLTGMLTSWIDHDFEFDPADYIKRFERLIRQQLS